jgi:hypothetical protein
VPHSFNDWACCCVITGISPLRFSISHKEYYYYNSVITVMVGMILYGDFLRILGPYIDM